MLKKCSTNYYGYESYLHLSLEYSHVGYVILALRCDIFQQLLSLIGLYLNP